MRAINAAPQARSPCGDLIPFHCDLTRWLCYSTLYL